MSSEGRQRITDVVVGAIAGGALGFVVALNLVILIGVEGGYEAGVTDIFDHSVLAGIVYLAVLVASPVMGVVLISGRRKRARSKVEDEKPGVVARR
jgi:hypothetical protein